MPTREECLRLLNDTRLTKDLARLYRIGHFSEDYQLELYLLDGDGAGSGLVGEFGRIDMEYILDTAKTSIEEINEQGLEGVVVTFKNNRIWGITLKGDTRILPVIYQEPPSLRP